MALRLIGVILNIIESEAKPFEEVFLGLLGDFAALPISTLLRMRSTASNEVTAPRPSRTLWKESFSEGSLLEVAPEFKDFQKLLQNSLASHALSPELSSSRFLNLVFGYAFECSNLSS